MTQLENAADRALQRALDEMQKNRGAGEEYRRRVREKAEEYIEWLHQQIKEHR